MIKVLTVFGTRPEAIKMAPVVKVLARYSEQIQQKVCVTAQHREMLDQVLKIFKITPDIDLNIMQPNQTLSTITSNVLLKMEEVIKDFQPDLVLVHGDTTTTFSAALAAFYQQKSIGHVEAGLRTYNKYSPFPEEINREFVSLVADLNFAPTQESADQLIQEKKDPKSIFVTGNTAIDALATTVKADYHHPLFDWLGDSRLVLLTAHRRENLGEPMRHIFRAVRHIVDEFQDVKVIYPVHLNPQVRQVAAEILSNHDRIKLIEPLEVIDFHNFMAKSYIILTDSGGVQEEAPSLGKPVLVLRDTTERPEGVLAGTLKLVGTQTEAIYQNAKILLTDQEQYRIMSQAKNPYGDGHASERIAKTILERF